MKSELDDLITILDDAVDMQDNRKYHDVLDNAYQDGILHDLIRYLTKKTKRFQELEKDCDYISFNFGIEAEQNKRYREAMKKSITFINSLPRTSGKTKLCSILIKALEGK